jgi:hypothetical protein
VERISNFSLVGPSSDHVSTGFKFFLGIIVLEEFSVVEMIL